jgi:hypothetical protein
MLSLNNQKRMIKLELEDSNYINIKYLYSIFMFC